MTRAIFTSVMVVLTLWIMGASGVVVAETKRGPVTNLPMPRFVSMKAAEGNVRRGPSLTHRVDWVFKHEKHAPESGGRIWPLAASTRR